MLPLHDTRSLSDKGEDGDHVFVGCNAMQSAYIFGVQAKDGEIGGRPSWLRVVPWRRAATPTEGLQGGKVCSLPLRFTRGRDCEELSGSDNLLVEKNTQQKPK